MIEFQLRVDSRILRGIIPKIEEYFASLRDCRWEELFLCPNPEDQDFSDAWKDGLKEDSSTDRYGLARVIKNAKFQHGFVQLEESEADSVIRGLSELRLAIRMGPLSKIEDRELETGNFDLDDREGSVRLAYFSYLVLAEMQEKLVSHAS